MILNIAEGWLLFIIIIILKMVDYERRRATIVYFFLHLVSFFGLVGWLVGCPMQIICAVNSRCY